MGESRLHTKVTTPAERMAQRMDELGLGPQEVAVRLGSDVTRQQIFKLKTGATKMSLDWALRLEPVLDTSWNYLLGLGDNWASVLNEETPGTEDRSGITRGIIRAPHLSDAGSAPKSKNASRQIPEYDVAPQAGSGAILGDLDGHERHPVVSHWSIPEQVLQANIGPSSSLSIIRVSGDSMEPEYMPGDRVMIDTQHKVPSPPGVYVIWDGYGVVLKRVELLFGSDPQRIRFKSINPDYATYERDLSEVIIHGRVVGKWMWK